MIHSKVILSESVTILIFSLLCSFHLSVRAQSTPTILPSILPPSPEASALGKYGDVPVGMFTGNPNFSIDLYDLKSKHLSVPITLNYSSNGIKVDEVSSKVGMSWTLNCGGMISRTVYSKPDLESYTVPSSPPNQNFEFASTDSTLTYWMQGVGAATNDDFQMDAFNFNFNGYAGKFFINPANGVPIIAPYTNLKIQYSLSHQNWNFKITTPDGTIYYFGGTGATEYTENMSTCTGGDHLGEIPTAWYLTKIQFPSDPSDSISFKYNPVFYEYATGINETVTYIDDTSYQDYVICSSGVTTGRICTCGPTPFIYGNPTPTNGQGTPQICQSISGIQGVCLSQISDGRYGLIKFTNIAKPDVSYDSLVSVITVYNNQTGARIKSYNFTYTQAAPGLSGSSTSYSVSAPRPFLTEVDELDSGGNVVRPWKFGYTSFGGLPPRLSYSQDYWGYFNGVVNPSLIPLPSKGYNAIATGLIGNRNPDYNSAGLGMLNQIIYPTGGYTSIQYEGNSLDSTYSIASQSTSVTYLTQSQLIDVNSSGSTNATFQVTAPVSVTITETIGCNSGATCAAMPDTFYWGELVLNNSDLVQTTYQKYNERQEQVATIVTMTLQPGVYGLDVLPNGNYSMDLKIAPSSSSDTLYIINTAVQVPQTNALSFTGGGMRVKRIVSYDPVSGDSTVKHYYYDKAIFPATLTYYNHLTHYESLSVFPNEGDACIAVLNANISAGYNQYFSNSLTSLYGSGTSGVYYTQVRESFGDNFDNGGVVHTFSYSGLSPIQFVWGQSMPNVVAPNLNWLNGLETSTETFKMSGATVVPVQLKTMSYVIDPRNSDTVNQFVVQQNGNNTSNSSNPGIICPDYSVAEVSYITQWQYMNSQITQDYDLNGNPTVADTQYYQYNNPSHAMLTSILGRDSKGEPTLDVKRYPQDMDSMMYMASGESTALDSMISEGRTGVPIENQSYKNGSFVKMAHSTYGSFGNGLVLPASVVSQNGTGAVYTDYTYNNYDPQGNPLQALPIDGITQNYIWDYLDELPIAKVVNAPQSDVAYTSFEADGSGNWLIPDTTRNRTIAAITGNLSYNLTGSNAITYTSLNRSTKYIIGYWGYTGNAITVNGVSGSPQMTLGNWTYYEIQDSGIAALSISGTGTIDELRLYPKGALMDTYTYTPLVGITTHTDPSGRITYYVYDGFQRLKLIKDQYGNILKKYDYEYQTGNH